MPLTALPTIIYIVLMALNQVKCQNISIMRGERDLFTKLSSCNLTKAVCYDTNCTYCQCDKSMTFIQARGEYGECEHCANNEHVAFVTSYNLSFLAQEAKKKQCLDYYFVPRRSKYRFPYTRSVCNSKSLAQRWLWTKNGQIFSLDKLECITIGWKYKSKDYYFLILEKCLANNKKQLWKCGRQDPYYVWQKQWKGYLNNGDKDFPRFVVSHKKESVQWRRYGSNQTLCSEAVGCEIFKDGSSLVVLNQSTKCEEISQCLGEKEILVRTKFLECSLLRNKTSYLLKDGWQPLMTKRESLDIVVNGSTLLLKWNLKKTPQSWKGIIVKVYFQCKSSENEEQNTDVYCILIKYSGVFAGFQKLNGSAEESENDDKSKTAVVIVCVLLIVLAIAVTVFLGYKNKNSVNSYIRRKLKRLDKSNTAQTSPGQLSGNNPIYDCDGKENAEKSCELYETIESEHVYQCANGGQPNPARENPTYDYAVPEDQLRNQFQQNRSELDNPEQSQHLYHVLENGNSQTS